MTRRISRKQALAAGLVLPLAVGGAGVLFAPAAASPQQGEAHGAAGRPLAGVLADIGKAVGLTIVADSSVAGMRVPPPARPATPDNFEAQITAVIQALPRGTTVVRLNLPAPPAGAARAWSGDDVALYAAAQARLFGPTAGAPTPAGTVEILGRRLPEAQAQAPVAALDLKPVYLVTNPNARTVGETGAAGWGQMTEEQRRQAARQAAERVLNMDPSLRLQYLQQHMMTFDTVMRQLPPDQHDALHRSMGAEVVRTPDGNVRVRRGFP